MFIIAGIGLNSFSEDKLRKIILTGADMLRYNFSYSSIEENINHIKHGKEIIEELHADVRIIADLPLKKIRLGDFDIKIFAVREKEEFLCKSANYSTDCNQFIPIQTASLGEKVRLNQIIPIGDGEVAVQVAEIIDRETIRIRVLNNGTIQYMKAFNTGHYTDEIKLLKKYLEIIERVAIIGIDYFAVSYIDKDIEKETIEEIIPKCGNKKIIIKIENQNGIDNIENICQNPAYHMVLMDRGELGVNIPYEKIGLVQDAIIKTCSKFKKPLIISTQILESTINNYIPYKSEIVGITNLVLQGVSGIMLCQETTMGMRPAYSIHVAKKIINETLANKKYYEQSGA